MHVEMKNINKTFGDFKASDHISFGIEKGKLIGLLGPSGSGKTTILRMLAGLEYPDSGDIFINGSRVNDLPASKRGIGFVFQNYALFRYMTVYDNIAFGLEIQKKNKKESKERVEELLSLIGLEGLGNRYPHQLSGGQKQRVAFARALAPNPQLLLLDEPFAAIDAKVRQELRSWLKETINKVGITSIFVTHDQDEAIEVADEIIITNKGRIEQKGSPLDIYRNPESLFVAEFVGQSSLLEDYSRLIGFKGAQSGSKAIIRPEFIKVSRKEEALLYPNSVEAGIVEKVSFRGSYSEIKIRVKDYQLTATRSLEEVPLSTGEEVNVLIYRLFTFGEQGNLVLENKAIEDKNPIYI
ncbi:ABC transporter ATP-binding protein [Anaerocolumna sp. AGMB13020]|uniref:ABC transporter ATP-binding protein n=1 Tax=Anaerocolumna sp. AGMB13020 TaxID=3081750 RepID=UPI002953948E|nr:ABC transporter ATP-binding protein [Anaerocolumna sp. AGMB13020]WOO37062.1 ABC transporter ATP-binding protein [Anaerocolumna sp. AGMB13020]